MLIDINPVVLSLGPMAVRWFGLFALAGLGLAIWLSLRDLARQPASRRAALSALAWALPAGLLTARLVYVLGDWDYFLTNAGELWQLNIAGLSLWGGLVGGGLVAAARLKRDTLRRRRILDVVAPYAALAVAIGRLGEFLEGQGEGLVSSLPWATRYANPLAASPDFGVGRHPAQLYDALVALALFALLKLLPGRLPAGTRFATFVVLYGLARVIMGPVRLDPAFLFGLQIEQLLAIGCVAVGIVFGLRPMLHGLSSRRAALDDGPVPTSHAQEDTLAA